MSDQLSAREAAALAGLQASTWDAYVTRGYAPEPDGRLGNQRWWYRSTVETWMATRPGRGARTDLRGAPGAKPGADSFPEGSTKVRRIGPKPSENKGKRALTSS